MKVYKVDTVRTGTGEIRAMWYFNQLLLKGSANMASRKSQRKTTTDSGASTGTAVAIRQADMPEGVKVVKRVTMPTLVMKVPDQSWTLFIRDEMRLSKIENKTGKDADGKARKMEPATICTVADVTTGEEFTWLVPSVVQSNLQRDYPDDGYVGKCFWIKNNGKRTPSQRYWDFSIAEVDVSGLTAKAQAA